ncbi:MAG: Rne/Rng family ribonuclease [Deltaproteobacteria bacterium]|nr:MAG: Rne/Rng family ribonuclease [Deltaproteobacteria bacterium]
MPDVLVINCTPQEARVALLEDGVISDYYQERRASRGVVGNIYLGRVTSVLPGMQAAFVDIGLEKAAFLYVSDVYDEHEKATFDEDDDEDDDGGDASSRGRGGRGRRRRNGPPIEEQLRKGQEVLVQVAKDPIGTKGARVTSHISIAGRHLVFMPTVDHLGISRQISSDRERKRLRRICEELRPSGSGFIVRTAASGVKARHLRNDMKLLIGLWNDILDARKKRRKAPALLHEDLDLILRATRDLATADLSRLVVDSRAEYDRIQDFIGRFMPRLAGKVELYVGKDPIFDAFGIEDELHRALDRKVNLPSGGHLVIDRAEALTAIDINTGKFVGSASLEETILQTNIEAAQEVAYQLRLRNIGGLIVVDFIDMDESASRKKVMAALEEALQGDRGRVKYSRLSEFGLVEMTRKRTRESLEQMLLEPCPTCGGSGLVKSAETVAHELLRHLRRELAGMKDPEVRVIASPAVIQKLRDYKKDSLRDIEMRANRRIHLTPQNDLAVDRFVLTGASRRKPRTESA